MKPNNYRLDWHYEAKKLKPYLEGKPGVVRINFQSDEAAVDKFNHFIKEQFQSKRDNGQWLSLRLDDEWSTTYTTDDQIFAIMAKLEEAGVQIDWSQAQGYPGDVASGNHSGHDLNITIQDSVVVYGMDASPKGVEFRLKLVCDAMRTFVESGGHFMLVVNDMKRPDQGKIWKNLWNAGLRDAGGDSISLIYYVGPQCGQEPHEDAPAPDELFKLPEDIETDEARQKEVFDDIIEVLTVLEGYGREAASAVAGSIVGCNSNSVRKLHMSLSRTILFNAKKKDCD